MYCPTDQRSLRRIELLPGLRAHECEGCAGHWLRFGDYLAWREAQAEDQPEVPLQASGISPSDPPSAGPRRCPDCDFLLARYRIGRGIHFTLDRCGNCNGVWLDGSEWATLHARGLHDNLHEVLGPGWQRALRAAEHRQGTEAQFQRQFGVEDYARAQEFGRWLSEHPRRSEIFAYLQFRIR